jgi:FkbM family methyltransferase
VNGARNALSVFRFIWTHPANSGRRFRQLARAVVVQTRGRFLRRATLVPLGARSQIWAEPKVPASSAVAYANPPDWPEMPVWSRHLRPGDLFVDVGANVGTYSVWALELGAHVIAIEPDAESRRRLAANVAANGYAVEVVNAALGPAPGVVRFTTGRDSLNRLALATETEAIEVPVTTLDEVLGDRHAAGVKIDVEGAEQLVLQGARRALAEKRIALLQLEWNPRSEILLGTNRAPVVELLTSLGYRLARPGPDATMQPVADPDYGPDVFAYPVEG